MEKAAKVRLMNQSGDRDVTTTALSVLPALYIFIPFVTKILKRKLETLGSDLTSEEAVW